MKLFQRIFFAAVLAGLAAGLAMSALQQWKVAPLILAAETYENAAPAVEEHTHPEGTAPHSHDVATAPALGLAPELPGMPAADLAARQLWWWGTALATGAGFLAIAKLRNWTGIGIAAVLLLAPHIIGAPQLTGDHASAVPAYLATEFAAAALAAGALFWLTVGPLLGYLTELFARRETTQLKAATA